MAAAMPTRASGADQDQLAADIDDAGCGDKDAW